MDGTTFLTAGLWRYGRAVAELVRYRGVDVRTSLWTLYAAVETWEESSWQYGRGVGGCDDGWAVLGLGGAEVWVYGWVLISGAIAGSGCGELRAGVEGRGGGGESGRVGRAGDRESVERDRGECE